MRKLDSVTGAGGSASFTYFSDGRVQTVSLPNSVSRSYTYDPAGRVNTMSQIVGGTEAQAFSYNYDPEGRLITIGCGEWAATYRCDSAGRFEHESRWGTGAYKHDYTYDHNDNRLTMTTEAVMTCPQRAYRGRGSTG